MDYELDDIDMQTIERAKAALASGDFSSLDEDDIRESLQLLVDMTERDEFASWLCFWNDGSPNLQGALFSDAAAAHEHAANLGKLAMVMECPPLPLSLLPVKAKGASHE